MRLECIVSSEANLWKAIGNAGEKKEYKKVGVNWGEETGGEKWVWA